MKSFCYEFLVLLLAGSSCIASDHGLPLPVTEDSLPHMRDILAGPTCTDDPSLSTSQILNATTVLDSYPATPEYSADFLDPVSSPSHESIFNDSFPGLSPMPWSPDAPAEFDHTPPGSPDTDFSPIASPIVPKRSYDQLEAADIHIPQLARLVDRSFLMPLEDVFSISDRGTIRSYDQ